MVSLYTYFSLEELRCKCPRCAESPIVPKPSIMRILTAMRQAFGKPIKITCGVRCPAHNAEVGGAPESRHLPDFADAVDIECTNVADRYELVALAIDWKVEVIELCPNHIHLDVRPSPARILFLGDDK